MKNYPAIALMECKHFKNKELCLKYHLNNYWMQASISDT